MISQLSVQWRLTAVAALATWVTSLCLTPTLTEGKWGLRVLAMVLLIAGVGGALRQLSTPRWLIPIVQALALLLAGAFMFARAANFMTVLPTLESLNVLRDLTSDALSAIWIEQPPVTVTEGVSLVVTMGVGAVALAVDALAVTWRRPLLSGLPLFLLYLVPAAVLPGGVPWPLFAASGASWILIQLADGRDRLTHWGRVIGSQTQGPAHQSILSGTGQRLGATALVAAIAIPMVIPSIGEGVFGASGGSGDEGDTGSPSAPEFAARVVTLNPIVDLKRDLTRGEDQEVFRYVTTDATPEYWRVATLDQFDGFTWTLAESSAAPSQQAATGLPAPPGLGDAVARSVQTSDVVITALNSKRLPLPYPTTRVDIEGDWRWDVDTLDVFSAVGGGNALGTSYTAESLDISPTVAQLEAAAEPADMEYYLIVPPDVQELLADETNNVVGDETNAYRKAQLLQNWFRSKFEYSLATADGNDVTDLAAFLSDKSGYCEQFAATMALMARMAGIPSRVQVGFTPGTFGKTGTWLVTAHDAHAWPELWFEGIGWVRFEPTPGGGDGNATPAWAPPPRSEVVQQGANQGRNQLPQLRRGPSSLRPDELRSRLPEFDRPGSLSPG